MIAEIELRHGEMTAWRRDLHAHPETAFEEHRTSDFVAGKLAGWGIAVHRGLAGTGVVGTLSNGEGGTVGLRADMDALHIHEANAFDHRSRHPGRMHACGHDGHTAMLLGAAAYLAETRRFSGTVRFIFQPAEENEGGGRRMVEEGLFDRFPCDAVYGMHNWPGLPAGTFAVWPGPVMASFDIFEATVIGRGAHGAMPQAGIDPIPIAAQIVGAWQTIVSRTLDPLEAAVLTVTQIHAGDTWNVIPERAVLRGTARAFKAEVQDQVEGAMRRIGEGIAEAMGAAFELTYDRRYPSTVNAPDETEVAARAAIAVAGEAAVSRAPAPSMGSEDFSFLLRRRPGAYIRIGNGNETCEGGCSLHNPNYDFNDAILTIGASYWATLVEQSLAGPSSTPT